jgi:serine/threonine protein kinase
MAYDWSAFIGQAIDDRYALRKLNADHGSGAEFLADYGGRTLLLRVLSADDPAAEEQLRSWKLATKLSHPNLLQVEAAGRARLDGIPLVYAATEAFEDNLGDVVPERPLSPDEARDVLSAVVACLGYLHSKGLVHRSVKARHVVAIGTLVKLTADTVTPMSDRDRPPDDMLDVGATIAEILTQRRRTVVDGGIASLPAPFRDIAIGCLHEDINRRWTVSHVADVLAGRTVEPEPLPEPAPPPARPAARNEAIPTAIPEEVVREGARVRVPTPLLVAIAALVVLLVGYLAFRNSSRETPSAKQPVTETEKDTRPSPVEPAPAAPAKSRRATLGPPPAEPTPSRTPAAGQWAVIAAAYANRSGAEKRAEAMARKFPRFHPEVLAPTGSARHYLVVLGSGMELREAEGLLEKARAAGLPRDAYVTRIAP